MVAELYDPAGRCGIVRSEIVTRGGGEGIDAVALMAHVVVALDALRDHLESRAPHPRLGCASIRAVSIAGTGGACTLVVERRTLPGERRVAVLDELGAAIATVGAEARTLLVRPAREAAHASSASG